MMEYSVYSVISPEGCASILFRDAKQSEKATTNLKITASDVVDLGVADEVVKEPLGGAHNNWEETAGIIKKTITSNLKQILKQANCLSPPLWHVLLLENGSMKSSPSIRPQARLNTPFYLFNTAQKTRHKDANT